MYPTSERQSPRRRGPHSAPPRVRPYELATDLQSEGGTESKPIVPGAESLSDAFLSDCILRCDRSLSSALRRRDRLRAEYQEAAVFAALEDEDLHPGQMTRGDRLLREVREQQQARRQERLKRAEATCSYLHEGFVAIVREALSRHGG